MKKSSQVFILIFFLACLFTRARAIETIESNQKFDLYKLGEESKESNFRLLTTDTTSQGEKFDPNKSYGEDLLILVSKDINILEGQEPKTSILLISPELGPNTSENSFDLDKGCMLRLITNKENDNKAKKALENFLDQVTIISSQASIKHWIDSSSLAKDYTSSYIITSSETKDFEIRSRLSNKKTLTPYLLVYDKNSMDSSSLLTIEESLSGKYTAEETDFLKHLDKYAQASGNIKLKQGPWEDSPVVSSIKNNTYLACYGESGDYTKVKYKGLTAYARSSDLKMIKDDKLFKILGGVLIINKNYSLPSDFNPGEDPEAKDAYNKMREAMKKESLGLYLNSGFRSYSYQKRIFNNYLAIDGDYARKYSAQAGHSEHQSGLAFDVSVSGESLTESFENTKSFKWLEKHADEYGFILRYPRDKINETGYIYEPWHYRFVGQRLAKLIKESGLSIEKYFNLIEE